MKVTKWTRKYSVHRYIYAIYKQFILTLQPASIGILVVVVWYFWFWKNGISFGESDSEILLLLTGPLLMLALLFVGGLAYTNVEKRKTRAVIATMTRDKESFLINRDERTSNVVLVFLASVIIFLVAQAMLTHWGDVYAGSFAVFICTFVGAKFWTIVVHLDNPVKSSRWLAERVPSEWLDIDIDQHFSLNGSEKSSKK
ncbi:MAG: hypothetical protein AAB632_03105 [Patescibacteria group bacterium]